MEPLSKPYIGHATGFAPRGRMACAANNGEYGSIRILADSRGNILVYDTCAITFELYKGRRRIIAGSLRLSGRNLCIIESVVNAVLYRRHIREMMEFEEFCDAGNNIPRCILKIPADFKV